MTEYEKMLSGHMYNAYDAELRVLSTRARRLVEKFANTDDTDLEARQAVLRELLGACGKDPYMLNASFDYGINTYIGDNFTANFNFTVLDCAEVHIGNDVLIGPNCTLATPVHPLLPEQRNIRVNPETGLREMYEYAKPITIGDNVWIASNVVVGAGVTIGEGAVIGAGSVVTRDIPPYSLAVGVPCRVIRKISEEDRLADEAII